MTQKEMVEIFSVMLLAYPNAEAFKGGIQSLKPTIELWTTCLRDVDFWTAQRAVVRLCRECKFPPTIAELKSKVDKIEQEIQSQIEQEILHIRMAAQIGRTNEEIYYGLQADSTLRRAIDAIGGPAALSSRMDNGASRWNFDRLTAAYQQVLRQQPVIGSTTRHPAIAGVKKLEEK